MASNLYLQLQKNVLDSNAGLKSLVMDLDAQYNGVISIERINANFDPVTTNTPGTYYYFTWINVFNFAVPFIDVYFGYPIEPPASSYTINGNKGQDTQNATAVNVPAKYIGINGISAQYHGFKIKCNQV